MRRPRAHGLALACGIACVLACAASCDSGYKADAANGADATAPATGTVGGACYANDTCNAGLTCASSLCVAVDGGSALLDGSTSEDNDADTHAEAGVTELDGSSDAAADGSSCSNALTAHSLLKFSCSGSEALCVGTGGNALCRSACLSNEVRFDCLGNAPCSGAAICCATNATLGNSTCPLDVKVGPQNQCTAQCDASEITICDHDGACAAGRKCLAAMVFGTNAYVGICQ